MKIKSGTGLMLDIIAVIIFIFALVVDFLTYTRFAGVLLATGWGILGFEIGTEKEGYR